ncbi:hypothetical protein HY419_01790 [candidate division WWE3 bacterium]|nr:hypothetical protein [candidate division WWE3 bacterium]
MNFLGHEEKFGFRLTPQKVLEELNIARASKNTRLINPDLHVVPTADLHNYFYKSGLGKIKTLMGDGHLNINTWKGLIGNDFLISTNHQQVYYFPDSNEISLDYIDKEVIQRILSETEFSYTNLLSFYGSVLGSWGPIEEGHVDLVVDIIDNSVVLANLNCVSNESYIRIPWNLFSNYLVIDWEHDLSLSSVKELPQADDFLSLRKRGYLPSRHYFLYGLTEVFYTTEKENLLNLVLTESSLPT